jgi:tRNA A-37 threonylcarbamoyl transferase component Bud32
LGYQTGGLSVLVTTDEGNSLPVDEEDRIKVPSKVKKDAFDALNKIHQRGVLHGNVRGENVVVREDHHVVLIDFDMSKIVNLHQLEQNIKLKAKFEKNKEVEREKMEKAFEFVELIE